MKLMLMVWTAAAAAVTVQLLAAAPLEMEEKELEEHALATGEVEVERREWRWEDEQEMIILDALREAFDTLYRYAKRLQRQRGKGKRREKARQRWQGRYDTLPGKRLLEGQGGDAEEPAAEKDDVARCRDFLKSREVHDAAGKAEQEDQEQVEGEQEEVQEGEQDEKQEEVDLKDLLQEERMLAYCLEVMD